MNRNIGDSFTAVKRCRDAAGGAMVSTFIITKITKAGVYYCDAVASCRVRRNGSRERLVASGRGVRFVVNGLGHLAQLVAKGGLAYVETRVTEGDEA